MALHAFLLDGDGWELYCYHAGQWQRGARAREMAELGPIPAHVPGHVQADLLAAGIIPNPYLETQSRLSEWVSTRHWEYSCEFTPPDTLRGKHLMLAFDGIDPGGVIRLNNVEIGRTSGLFFPVEIEVTSVLRFNQPNRLQIFLSEAPATPNQQGTLEGVHSPQVRFGAKWDFGARYQPVGLWQGVRLEAFGRHRLVDVWARPHFNGTQAVVTAAVTLITGDESHEVRTTVYQGDTVLSTDHSRHSGGKSLQEITQEHYLSAPQRWYPNGCGAQPLYRLVAEIFDSYGELSDRREVTFGLRDIRYVRNEGTHHHALPYSLVVNGTPIFLKGWHVLPVDHLYGVPNAEKLRRLLRLAKDAGANMVRVWGGGLLESETFYALCDEFGLLVWQQDFLNAGGGQASTLAHDQRLLTQWEALAPIAIRQRRNHPSLAIWCGGDKLLGRDGKPATTHEPVIGLLGRMVREYDPDRLFLPASPSGPVGVVPIEQTGEGAPEPHDIHGPWNYLGPERHYTYLNALRPLLFGAGGCAGATNGDAMLRVAEESRLWPPVAANPLWAHRAAPWTDHAALERLFGPLTTLASYIQASQLMQAEGIRYLVEAARRQCWHCAGVLLWQLNEPWPNLACTNVVDYFGQPKTAYYAAANAFQLQTLSARYPKLAWTPGAPFTAELYLTNNVERAQPLEVCWSLHDLRGNTLAGWGAETLSHPNSVSRMDDITWDIPADFAEPFLLRLLLQDAHGTLLHHNDYLFSATPAPLFTPLLALPPATLATQLQAEDDRLIVTVTNQGDQTAFGVTLTRPDGHWCYGIDNARHLLPGETWTTTLTLATRAGFYMALDTREPGSELTLTAWNTPAIQIPWEAATATPV